MQNPNELFDVVDERDCVIGQAPRSEVHARGLRHRAIHVLLFNLRGELLVQRRSATKDTAPGCYDSSASGHLDSGEDYDAGAYREVREELGLKLPDRALTRLLKLEAGPDTGWEFVWVYACRGEYRITPHSGEIESVAWLNRADVEKLVTGQPERCARSFCRIVREAFGCNLPGIPV